MRILSQYSGSTNRRSWLMPKLDTAAVKAAAPAKIKTVKAKAKPAAKKAAAPKAVAKKVAPKKATVKKISPKAAPKPVAAVSKGIKTMNDTEIFNESTY